MNAEAWPRSEPNWFALAEPIVQDVADRHGVDVADLLGPSHERRLVRARQEAAYLLAEQHHACLTAIAEALGRTDHTTARHAIHEHARRHGLPVPRTSLVMVKKKGRTPAAYAAIEQLRDGVPPRDAAALTGISYRHALGLAQSMREGASI